MATLVKKVFLTLVLIALTTWLFRYSWQQRHVFYENYDYTHEEAQRLRRLPKAQYAHGMRAWLRHDTNAAAGFFRQAVSQNIFFMDGWFKLAEVQALIGNLEKANTILSFTDKLTARTFRWKWSQTLLAHELGMDDIFLRNINYLIAHSKLVEDALQLLETHFKHNRTVALHSLDQQNLTSYLKWLMRWDQIDDSIEVWQKIAEIDTPDSQMMLQFMNFLINNKRIKEAQAIWHPSTEKKLMTNAGFEEESTRQAFDWRYGTDRDGRWEIKRVESPTYEGTYALEVSFSGRENLSFHHLYQIVPVEPMKPCRLTYWWRSENITTDQGPFFDIYSYDQKGLHEKGVTITGTNDWRYETIPFTTPENCHAVVLRLRRLQSHRFDRNISGKLWLDNFRLEILD